jgi:hypothetical protein
MYRPWHLFTLALVKGEWSASCPCRFTSGHNWIGGSVALRARLGDLGEVTILDTTGTQNPTPFSSSS